MSTKKPRKRKTIEPELVYVANENVKAFNSVSPVLDAMKEQINKSEGIQGHVYSVPDHLMKGFVFTSANVGLRLEMFDRKPKL